MPSVKGDIVPLTSIRGIAATWVVAYHLINNLVYRGWLDRPNAIIANIIEGGSGFADDIFFVLSGYILATTYGVKSDFPTFIVYRIARVFPLM